MEEFFSRLMTFTAQYKGSNCCKIVAAIQRCSVKKLFLKVLQSSQENPRARVSFLTTWQVKKRLWYRYYPVNIAKFLRKHFYTTPVVTSREVRTKSLKSAKFQFQLFLTTLDIISSLQIAINLSFYLKRTVTYM